MNTTTFISTGLLLFAAWALIEKVKRQMKPQELPIKVKKRNRK